MVKSSKKDKKEKKSKRSKEEKNETIEQESTIVEETQLQTAQEQVSKAEPPKKEAEESYDFLQYHSNFQSKTDRKQELDENEEGSDSEDPIKVIEPKIKKAKVEKPPKPETYGVWVGNLFFNITEEELRDFFKNCGTITRFKMPMVGNKNRGFAFIDFETPEQRDKALELSETIMFKRPLLIKDSKDFNKKGRTQAPEDSKNSKTQQAAFLRSQSHAASATLFIGNLPFECTSDFLLEKFQIYGKVKKVRLATFEDTNRCKGFGYIDFEQIDDSTKALLALKDRFKVEYASVDATRRGRNLQPNQAKEFFKKRDNPNNDSNESSGQFNNERQAKKFKDQPSTIGDEFKGTKITFDE